MAGLRASLIGVFALVCWWGWDGPVLVLACARAQMHQYYEMQWKMRSMIACAAAVCAPGDAGTAAVGLVWLCS